MSYLENFNINQKPEGFADHLTLGLIPNHKSRDHLDTTEYYEQLILNSLQGHYTDLEDFINIQQALMKVQARVIENIKQCLQDL